MKKIFILSILIVPIVAHATDPVGPAHVNSGAVVATANAPYATADAETGDTTQVVSASYVKGAYNDAIAAINNVANKVSTVEGDLSSLANFVNGDIEDEIAEKQDKLVGRDTGNHISSDVVETSNFDDVMLQLASNGDSMADTEYQTMLVTAGAVATGIMSALNRTGVKAVTTWGSNTETTLGFVPN